MIRERGFVARRPGPDAVHEQLHAVALRRGMVEATCAQYQCRFKRTEQF